MKEYGRIKKNDPRTEMYGWYEVPHTFLNPMYYISYATSAAGALMFWEESQEDYFATVDHYLAFVAQPGDVSFQDSFKNVGLISPLSENAVKRVDGALHKYLLCVYAWYDGDGQLLACTTRKIDLIRDNVPDPYPPTGAEGYELERVFYLDPDTYAPLYPNWSSK
ncbi:MAG: hypothetical protein J5449_04410 [Oscillospiraceae bacterium]|nr:hypothetical protein [Oscillospiraceae bacterium]